MRYPYQIILLLLVNFKFVIGQEIDTTSVPPIFKLEKSGLNQPINPQLNNQLLLDNKNLNFKYSEYNFNVPKSNKIFISQAGPYILPATLFTLSLYSMSDEAEGSFIGKRHVRTKLQSPLRYSFHNSADDYIQYAPLLITAGLKLTGVQGKNDAINSTLIAAKAHALNAIIVTSLKRTTKVYRPNKSAYTSFPSGHTTTAFCNATIMHMEFGNISPWYSVVAYSMATATGAMRMMNDVHWLPDVLAGAAIGITTTRLIYATHKYRWGKKPTNLVIIPTVSRKSWELNLAYTF